jgi:3,4-dihydroxy 2-butanone 4-phosphate synthase/GTP cyclohydrolase II
LRGQGKEERKVPLSSIEEAIAEVTAGRMVIVVDDYSRENEGDLVMAAELATPQAINFMATNGRGLICVSLLPERFEELEIPMMVEGSSALFGTAFGVSVDLKGPGRTGISTFDRAATIQALCNPKTKPSDLARPGHVFPLRSAAGGVLQRPGHTEAAAELALLSGMRAAGVLCEILDTDGAMARLPQLETFARIHKLRMIAIADLIAYRRSRKPVRRITKPHLVQS